MTRDEAVKHCGQDWWVKMTPKAPGEDDYIVSYKRPDGFETSTDQFTELVEIAEEYNAIAYDGVTCA